jgi:small GTP-binding protein
MEKKEILYKILLLGDSSVGKSCLLKRYTDNTFLDIHISTIGLDYKLKEVKLKDGKTVKVQIWDTAGQDRFRAITKNYYKGAQGIALIYDITNQITFENVRKWIDQIKEEVSEKVPIILVGNKIDIVERRVIKKEDGESMAKEYGLLFSECSAKTGENIDSTFNQLVEKTVENYSKVKAKGETLNNKKNKKKSCC